MSETLESVDLLALQVLEGRLKDSFNIKDAFLSLLDVGSPLGSL